MYYRTDFNVTLDLFAAKLDPESSIDWSIEAAIKLAPEQRFAVEPPPPCIKYCLFGHGVDLVPQVWPHAECVFACHSGVGRSKTSGDNPGSGDLGPSDLYTSDHNGLQTATLNRYKASVRSRGIPNYWFIDNMDFPHWDRFLDFKEGTPSKIIWFTEPAKLLLKDEHDELKQARKAAEKVGFTTTYWHLSSPDYGSGLHQDRLAVIRHQDCEHID